MSGCCSCSPSCFRKVLEGWNLSSHETSYLLISKLEQRAAHIQLERHPSKSQKVKRQETYLSTLRLFEIHKDTFSPLRLFKLIFHTFRLGPCSAFFQPSSPLPLAGWFTSSLAVAQSRLHTVGLSPRVANSAASVSHHCVFIPSIQNSLPS